jgi:hypothetical protein
MRNARLLKSGLASVVLATTVIAAVGVATPASLASPVAPQRELEFTPSELRLFKDLDTGKQYWFMTYDVVNNTGVDQRFAPRIDLVVDDGRILAQGDGVSSTVVRQIKAVSYTHLRAHET